MDPDAKKVSDTWFGSDAAIWLERMGFNGKQVSMAAEQIGLSGRHFMRKRDGTAELNLTERLAMAALRAGLPPWSPETDQHLADMGEARRLILEIAERERNA